MSGRVPMLYAMSGAFSGALRGRRAALAPWLLALVFLGAGCGPGVRVISAGPSNYSEEIRRLKPGDVLRLDPGIYRQGLRLHDLDGRPGHRIVITGPEDGGPAVFVARDGENTVSIENASFITIRNLTLDGQHRDADAVKAEGTSRYAHHITLENLLIRGYNADQSLVGISTKCPAWDWIVRGNVIDGAGTGMYFGDSDGTAPFIAGLIEGNLVRNTIGYGLQIKHQVTRELVSGMPQGPRVTVIRYNVFDKSGGGAQETMARPNVLLGQWPPSGPGRLDRYLVHNNFFYQNPTEALLQATGRLAIYNNLFVNTEGVGRAVIIMKHHGGMPEAVEVFHNTVLASGIGIAVWDPDPAGRQWVAANAVFGAQPIVGHSQGRWNVSAPLSAAAVYLNAPLAPLAHLDLYPRPGKLRLPAMPKGAIVGYPDAERDFNRRSRRAGFVGAYADEGGNPATPPASQRMILPPALQ